mmetsp:Transcript_49269/g.107196  ORF Transcript_49269/g.107196 Transcript_49269/m.107196 type:complete len:441 (-) Transcript_49269:62-1384(-)
MRAEPPPFPQRPVAPPTTQSLGDEALLTARSATPRPDSRQDCRDYRLCRPPPGLELPSLVGPRRTAAQCERAAQRSRKAQRAALASLRESSQEMTPRREAGFDEMPMLPVIGNIAPFVRPPAYDAILRGPVAGRRRNWGQRPLCAPIDEAIQREFLGDGVTLDKAVASRRDAGWAVKQRQLQKHDVGHCCYACRQPLRDLSEEVTVWTGAAIYRRFHPPCAASYVLRADRAAERTAGEHGGSGEGPACDVVVSYADGWRRPRGGDVGHSSAAVAARQWLLSQDPGVWPALRGDLFTTVTVTENGKKKAVPGLSHEQLRLLQAQHSWHADDSAHVECAICLSMLEPRGPSCLCLPCAPQHVFHVSCVLPWLRKASLCPVCRKDIRPLLGRAHRSRESCKLLAAPKRSTSIRASGCASGCGSLEAEPGADEHDNPCPTQPSL